MGSKQEKSKMKKKWTTIPLVDINRIMQSSAEIHKDERLAKEVLVLVSKTTEFFIKKFTQDCVAYTKTKIKRLKYKHFMKLVQNKEAKYSFLEQIVPKKITVGEYKEIMARKEADRQKEEANH